MSVIGSGLVCVTVSSIEASFVSMCVYRFEQHINK